MSTTLSATAQRAIQAYGGAERWAKVERIEVELSVSGWLFRLKWQPAIVHGVAVVQAHEPHARLTPIDRKGNTGVFESDFVRIEDATGHHVEGRTRPRRLFPWGRRALYWDRLDQAYFSGYALWNYLTLPVLLGRADLGWQELEDGVLEAHFPPEVPTHCPVQRFVFDRQSGLLRELHYGADVVGPFARAVNVVLEHRSADGVPYPAVRRVVPALPGGRPAPGPLLVGIEFHQHRLVERA
jgi:hypothetical protein